MNLDLKNKKWKEFVISDILEIERSTNKSLSNKTSSSGIIDYVGATSRNNGSVGFVSQKYKNLLKQGNCIVFINTGEGSVGEAIYKQNNFIPSNNVTIGRSKFLNKYIGNFIVTINNNQSDKYSYGYIRNEKRLKRDILMLPANDKGEPDFEFMESFMKQKEQEKLVDYNNYISQRLKRIKKFITVEPIEDKEWSEFFLKDIFKEIQRGKRLKKADHKKGKMPYVSSTGLNNGVDGYVGNKEKVRIFSDCLTIANSGSVGACFYQPFEFVASDHVTKLKNENLNEYSYKFISSLVKRLGVKYSFNREMNDTRIKKEKILLPTNDKNEPDYEYMENYMKQLEYKKLNEYLKRKTN